MGQHHFVLVMTQERMFSQLAAKSDLTIDYIFIDEAHKISQNDSRSVFYFKISSMLLNQKDLILFLHHPIFLIQANI